MKVKTISHVAFMVKDMEVALRFYRDGLGFRPVCDITYDFVLNPIRKSISESTGAERAGYEAVEQTFRGKEGKPWFVYLRMTEDQLLELFYADDDYDNSLASKCSYRHLSLEVEDIEAAKHTLLDRGIQLKTDIYMGPDSTKTLWIVDPDGNEIELMEYTPDSLQMK